MKEPQVSVVIPTYNRAHTVSETIDSVLQQTYPQIEVIVVDDGSKDNTQEVLRSYGSRIRIVRQDNAGQMAARNRGIHEARGDIITFLDSDDVWLPHCVGSHIRLLQRVPSGIPCSLVNAWLHFADGRKITSFHNSQLDSSHAYGLCLNMPEILATRFVLFCQCVAIRREALDKVGGFAEDLEFMEDYDLPLRLSVLGPWAFVSEPLVIWRQGDPGSVSISQRAIERETELRESLLIIRKRYLEVIQDHPEFVKAKELQLWALHLDQLELQAINLRRRGEKFRGDLLFKAVQYRKKLFRRGPWFPKMEIAKTLSV